MNIEVKHKLSDRVSTFLGQTHKLFIGGEWVEARSGETIDVKDPATGDTFATIAAGGAEDIDRAVQAARDAFDNGPWSTMGPLERARYLWKLSDLIEAAVDDVSQLVSLDNGMPLFVSKHVVALSAVRFLRYNAGWCGKIDGSVPTPVEGGRFAYTLKQPIGVVGAITPWNFPFIMEVEKIGQALAAGCTIVLKPSELSPMGALLLGQFIQEAGIPAGVVNIVPGYGDPAGKALADHPKVNKIAFTGSTATGQSVVRAASNTFKRVSLELGGKSPTLIFPDADLEKAIPGAALSVFSNAGQMCVAGSRVYAHKSVFDKVVAGIGGMAQGMRVGPGLDPQTQIGPLISPAQLDRVAGFVESGLSEGAEAVAGGARVGGGGSFFQPTVLAETRQNMKVVQEEIFGPVVCVMPFDEDDIDAIARTANDTNYGLAAYIWSRDVNRVHGLARRLHAGTIHVNGGLGGDPALPFGGFNQSGWGRDRGRDGVEAMLETKSVIIAL